MSKQSITERTIRNTARELEVLFQALTWAEECQHLTPPTTGTPSGSKAIVSDPTGNIATNEERLALRKALKQTERNTQRIYALMLETRTLLELASKPYS